MDRIQRESGSAKDTLADSMRKEHNDELKLRTGQVEEAGGFTQWAI